MNQKRKDMKKTMERELESARIAIESALNYPDILKKLSKFGYDRRKLQEGRAICEELRMVTSRRGKGYGTQKQATRHYQQARQETHALYMYHVSIARLALIDRHDMWDVLRLNGRRKTDIAGWLEQVRAFYGNINQVADIMAKYNVGPEELARAREMVVAVADFRIHQVLGKSEAQQATQQRRRLRQQLQQWMRNYIYIARFALKDDEQQLEAMGIIVPS